MEVEEPLAPLKAFNGSKGQESPQKTEKKICEETSSTMPPPHEEISPLKVDSTSPGVRSVSKGGEGVKRAEVDGPILDNGEVGQQEVELPMPEEYLEDEESDIQLSDSSGSTPSKEKGMLGYLNSIEMESGDGYQRITIQNTGKTLLQLGSHMPSIFIQRDGLPQRRKSKRKTQSKLNFKSTPKKSGDSPVQNGGQSKQKSKPKNSTKIRQRIISGLHPKPTPSSPSPNLKILPLNRQPSTQERKRSHNENILVWKTQDSDESIREKRKRKSYFDHSQHLELLGEMDWKNLDPRIFNNSPLKNPPMTKIAFWFKVCAEYYRRSKLTQNYFENAREMITTTPIQGTCLAKKKVCTPTPKKTSISHSTHYLSEQGRRLSDFKKFDSQKIQEISRVINLECEQAAQRRKEEYELFNSGENKIQKIQNLAKKSKKIEFFCGIFPQNVEFTVRKAYTFQDDIFLSTMRKKMINLVNCKLDSSNFGANQEKEGKESSSSSIIREHSTPKKNLNFLEKLITARNIKLENMVRILEEDLQKVHNRNSTLFDKISGSIASSRLEESFFDGTYHEDDLIKDIHCRFPQEIEFLNQLEQQQQTNLKSGISSFHNRDQKPEQPPKEAGQESQRRKAGGDPKNSKKVEYICKVCSDGDYSDDNEIVMCSRCNISVHQRCYHLGDIPEGNWVCDLCLAYQHSGRYMACPLCYKRGGIMRQCQINSYDSYWAKLNKDYYEEMRLEEGETRQRALITGDQSEIIGDDCISITSGNFKQFLYYDYYEEEKKAEVLENVVYPKSKQAWVHLSCVSWMPELSIPPKIEAQVLTKASSKRKRSSKDMEVEQQQQYQQQLQNSSETKPKETSNRGLTTREIQILRVEGFKQLDKKRFNLYCLACGSKSGACVQCVKGKCQASFHVECGRVSNTFMEVCGYENDQRYIIYCESHAPLKIKRTLENNWKQSQEEIAKFCRSIDKYYSSVRLRTGDLAPEPQIRKPIKERRKEWEKMIKEQEFYGKLRKHKFIREIKHELNQYLGHGNIISLEKEVKESPNSGILERQYSYKEYHPISEDFIENRIPKDHKVWSRLAKSRGWKVASVYSKYKRMLGGEAEEGDLYGLEHRVIEGKKSKAKRERMELQMRLRDQQRAANLSGSMVYESRECDKQNVIFIPTNEDRLERRVVDSGCEQWFHPSCLGVNNAEEMSLNNLEIYCPDCKVDSEGGEQLEPGKEVLGKRECPERGEDDVSGGEEGETEEVEGLENIQNSKKLKIQKFENLNEFQDQNSARGNKTPQSPDISQESSIIEVFSDPSKNSFSQKILQKDLSTPQSPEYMEEEEILVEFKDSMITDQLKKKLKTPKRFDKDYLEYQQHQYNNQNQRHQYQHKFTPPSPPIKNPRHALSYIDAVSIPSTDSSPSKPANTPSPQTIKLETAPPPLDPQNLPEGPQAEPAGGLEPPACRGIDSYYHPLKQTNMHKLECPLKVGPPNRPKNTSKNNYYKP